jgi:uncharacterized membrane protein (DUF485 family)
MIEGAPADDQSAIMLANLAADPRFRLLVRRRARFAWLLTAAMLSVFFGFILLVAFDRDFLARPVGAGFTSIGIPLGLGVILAGIAFTSVYVRRANREFDPMLEALLQEHKG